MPKKPQKPKKPQFKELTESTIKSTGKRSTRSAASSSGARPNMKIPPSKSVEGRGLEAINKQMGRLYEYIPSEDNPYLSAFHEAMDAVGLERRYRIVNGEKVPVIRNTAENRKKFDEFRTELNKRKAKTMTDIRNQAREELRREGKKQTESNIKDKLETNAAFQTLSSNAQFVYNEERSGNYTHSHLLDEMRGFSRNEHPEEYSELVKKFSREMTAIRRREREEIAAQYLIDPDNVF